MAFVKRKNLVLCSTSNLSAFDKTRKKHTHIRVLTAFQIYCWLIDSFQVIQSIISWKPKNSYVTKFGETIDTNWKFETPKLWDNAFKQKIWFELPLGTTNMCCIYFCFCDLSYCQIFISGHFWCQTWNDSSSSLSWFWSTSR